MEDHNTVDTDALKERIKEIVEKGNVSRIQIRKDETVIMNIPVNAGILGGVLGAMAAPWAMIAGTVATLGLNCSVEFIREDGSVFSLTDTEIGQKAVSAGTFVMDNLKNAVGSAVSSITENRDPDVYETKEYDVDDE